MNFRKTTKPPYSILKFALPCHFCTTVSYYFPSIASFCHHVAPSSLQYTSDWLNYLAPRAEMVHSIFLSLVLKNKKKYWYFQFKPFIRLYATEISVTQLRVYFENIFNDNEYKMTCLYFQNYICQEVCLKMKIWANVISDNSFFDVSRHRSWWWLLIPGNVRFTNKSLRIACKCHLKIHEMTRI